MLGVPILVNMKQTEANLWNGKIYDARGGSLWDAKISLSRTDMLEVRGCVGGFLCGGDVSYQTVQLAIWALYRGDLCFWCGYRERIEYTRFLCAFIPTAGGEVYIKLTGPKDTVDSQKPAFEKFLQQTGF